MFKIKPCDGSEAGQPDLYQENNEMEAIRGLPRQQCHSQICMLGKRSYQDVCTDLCKHYCFHHKFTILVTLVLKMSCSITSFSKNFSNSRYRRSYFSCELTPAQAHGHWCPSAAPAEGLEGPWDRWGQEEQHLGDRRSTLRQEEHSGDRRSFHTKFFSMYLI